MIDTPQSHSNLESRQEITKIDKENVLGSIEAFADQIRHAWEETKKLNIQPLSEVSNIVVSGMGGSAIGSDVIKFVFKDKLNIPFEIIHSYDLPNYVNKNTLVVLSSYSGNTEEVLSTASQAIKNRAQILVISAGGKLAEFALEHQIPLYLIDPKHNPSNQPRMAVGYSMAGIIGMLTKAQILNVSDQEINEVITTIISTSENLLPETPTDKNQAKMLAFECLGRRPILVSSEFMEGAIHTSANQFNENSKSFADYKVVPEINHHLLEGLKFPDSNQLNHIFMFVNSDLFDPRNQKRMKLTQQIAQQNNIETISFELSSPTKLTQVFEEITLMAFVNFYLSILQNIDPAPIPFVDWFKQELNKPSQTV